MILFICYWFKIKENPWENKIMKEDYTIQKNAKEVLFKLRKQGLTKGHYFRGVL